MAHELTRSETASPVRTRRALPWRRVLGRAGVVVAVLWGAATIAFIAVKLIPGDPVAILAGGENIVDAAQREEIRAKFGLDQPLWVQYLQYLGRALTGDFGDSYTYRRPVIEVLGEALGPTSQLATTAVLLAVALALASALLTAGRRSVWRSAAATAELLILSTPVYWIGIFLLAVFSFQLGWFPVIGNDGFKSLVLPAITLSLPIAALLSQVLRDGLEESLEQPFTLTARARGISELRVRLSHSLRHALLAVSTLTGTLLASVLGGSILTETVFGRYGLGSVTIAAIGGRDMPLVLGIVIFSALLFLIVSLIVDALYLVIDPRIRKAGSTR